MAIAKVGPIVSAEGVGIGNGRTDRVSTLGAIEPEQWGPSAIPS
jgi:hypothetical protein